MNKLIITAGSIMALLAAMPAARAQHVTPTTIQAPAKSMVVVHITKKEYSLHAAVFDTDGERIGNLSDLELSKKFYKNGSIAALLNFVIQNGYRVVSFTPLGNDNFNGRSAAFSDHIVLFERLK